MAGKKRPNPKTFKRAKQVRRLQEDEDPRWKKAACDDLEEMSQDHEGMTVLVKAIKAMLRK